MNISKSDLINLIKQYQEDLDRYLNSLPREDHNKVINTVGWQIKDVLIHLATWQQGIVFLLQGNFRAEGMGIPQDLVDNWDVNSINDHIYQQNKEKSYQEAREFLTSTNKTMIEQLTSMTEEDLLQPYSSYDPTTPFHTPVVNWINGNTHGHFKEHLEKLRSS